MNVHVFGNKKRYYIIKDDPEGTEMEQPKLLDPVRNMIRTKHYSIRTEEAYVGWIKRFILFYGKRHPKELGKKEISAFLTHPAVNRNVSASTRNQRALRFGVLWRKRSLGSQSDKALRWVEGICPSKKLVASSQRHRLAYW